jgi:ubiquinone/menaquinone biosynthesis C-methylase UbiE
MPAPKSLSSAHPWERLGFLFAPEAILFTAFELGLFDAFGARPRSAAELAARCGLSERGVPRLLETLAALGLVDRVDGRYALAPLARRFCLAESGDYMGAVALSWKPLMFLWLGLPEAVRTGRPIVESLPKRWRRAYDVHLAHALFRLHREAAWELARKLRRPYRDVLDVAAGSCVWSLPFALSQRRARVTALDSAAVLRAARGYARAFGVEKRYRFLAGDLHETALGEERYDLALAGHICHSEGPEGSRKLILRCHRALRPGGSLVVLDHLLSEERDGPWLALLFSLNALLGSARGDAFSFAQCRSWMREAGFERVRKIRLASHPPAIAAVKPLGR